MTSIPKNPEPIRRKRLYEEVVERLEQLIHSGQLKPGDPLPVERELMEMYGVGRPAIREAILTLQKAGLVSVTGGSRARVTEPTAEMVVESLSTTARHLLADPDGVRNFQEARKLFEVGLVRYAAKNASKKDLQKLKKALKENHQSIGDINWFERTDMAFHYVLAVIPNNPIFTAIHAAISDWLYEQRHTTLSSPGQNEVAYQAHAAIAEAIIDQNADLAERLMEQHLDQVAKVYWEAKEEQ